MIEQTTKHTAAESNAAARTAHIAAHMKDLPAVYRDLMPHGTDAAGLAAAEKAIRKIYSDDWLLLPAEAKEVRSRFRIATPKNPDFSGELGGLKFTNGVAWTESTTKVAWLREQGCIVTDHLGQ